jgi:hypothetical protein
VTGPRARSCANYAGPGKRKGTEQPFFSAQAGRDKIQPPGIGAGRCGSIRGTCVIVDQPCSTWHPRRRVEFRGAGTYD